MPPATDSSASSRLAGAPWVRLLPLRTPTLPPATHTSCLLVGEADRVAVIDPGSPYPEEQARLERFVSEEGLRLDAVLLTHHHGDHVGGAKWLAARFGLPIWAHAETARRLPGLVVRPIGDGERLPYGPAGLETLHTPGHAPGHLSWLDRAARALFVGDMVAGVGTIIIDPDDGGDLGAYLASLERLRQCALAEAATLLPAHGAPIAHGAARLEFYLEHRRARERALLGALDERWQGEGELLPQVYPELDPALYPLARCSLRAHLFKLAAEGRAVREGARWRRGPSPA